MSTQITVDKDLVKYLEKVGYRSDPVIDQLVKETAALGSVAQMQIAPEQGQFLEIIVKISQSNKCLEIGRFTGLSTLCMAKGLPETGSITTIDNSDEFLPIAQKYWQMAGVSNKIDSIIGAGVEVMQSFIDRQYFCAIGKNSSELSIVVIEPVSGSPLAIHKVLRPVKRPISKHLFDWDILTIISKN